MIITKDNYYLISDIFKQKGIDAEGKARSLMFLLRPMSEWFK